MRFGLLAVVATGACAHARPHPHQLELEHLLQDARTPAAFAAHFAPGVPPDEIESWRTALVTETDPTGFELLDNRGCNRITWGEWVIDHSYYVFFTDRREVTSIEYDSGFGQAFAAFGAEHRDRPPSAHARCEAAH